MADTIVGSTIGTHSVIGVTPPPTGANALKHCLVCGQDTGFTDIILKASLPFGTANTLIGAGTNLADADEIIGMVGKLCPVCGYVHLFTNIADATIIPPIGTIGVDAGSILGLTSLQIRYKGYKVGDTIVLPTSVKAYLVDKETELDVNVTWDPLAVAAIDNTKVGIYNIKGKISDNGFCVVDDLTIDSNNPYITVVIANSLPCIVHLQTTNTVKVTQGTNYVLPTTIPTIDSVGNVSVVPIGIQGVGGGVGWDHSTVDTSILGTTTVTGTVQIDGLTYTTILYVTVVA